MSATGEQEEYVVVHKQMRGVMESVIRNQKTKELQAAARKHPGLLQSDKVAAHNAAIRARHEKVKVENEAGYVSELTRAGGGAIAGPSKEA